MTLIFIVLLVCVIYASANSKSRSNLLVLVASLVVSFPKFDKDATVIFIPLLSSIRIQAPLYVHCIFALS